MQDRIISFITSHSRVKEDYLRKLMSETEQMANDIGSVIDGKEAVECGLIDQVGGISDALCALRELTKK
jgi:ATP-dependent protease ClpP protease subunit